MQRQQFNKLFKPEDLQRPMAAFYERETNEPITKETVAEKQQPMPVEMEAHIRKFIVDSRKAGDSERKIRRAVKRKFNITVL